MQNLQLYVLPYPNLFLDCPLLLVLFFSQQFLLMVVVDGVDRNVKIQSIGIAGRDVDGGARLQGDGATRTHHVSHEIKKKSID